ncbi:MAG: DUF4159 domain-containing protein [Acidobacteriota bacterium]
MRFLMRRIAWRRFRNGAIGRFLCRKTVWALLSVALFSAGIWWAYGQEELPRNETKFTWSRVKFNYPPSFRWRGGIGDSNGPPWSHDWPRSEENLMKIMAELTKLDVNPGGHIFTFDSDDCFKYPIAYLCEVGYLTLSAKEVQNMREYLLRGGFLVVDDFRTPREMYNFADVMKEVFPERNMEEVPRTDPIWTCFYDISNLWIEPPYSRFNRPAYYGMRDDSGRLMMIIDYNNDISEYWEWSADPFYKIEDTNEAFKYGVNYLMYALTH